MLVGVGVGVVSTWSSRASRADGSGDLRFRVLSFSDLGVCTVRVRLGFQSGR